MSEDCAGEAEGAVVGISPPWLADGEDFTPWDCDVIFWG